MKYTYGQGSQQTLSWVERERQHHLRVQQYLENSLRYGGGGKDEGEGGRKRFRGEKEGRGGEKGREKMHAAAIHTRARGPIQSGGSWSAMIQTHKRSLHARHISL